MKSLKEILMEGFLRKNLGLGHEELIKKWLDEHRITNYTINSDWTIDIEGSVNLMGYAEKQLPDYIQFGKVTGYFRYNECENLKSLNGCPKEVGKSFNCSYCPKLESLEGAPQKVGTYFNCSECSNLKSLQGGPQEVRDFNCKNCPNLKSLKGAPQKVGGYFKCVEYGGQFTKDDVKKVCKVKRYIYV